jgi:hypothetical protein
MRTRSKGPPEGVEDPLAPGGDRSGDDFVSASDRLELEKQLALREPGPTWREWAFFTGFKPWFAVGFLIADAWIATGWLEAGNLVAMGVSLVAAVYLELLLYRYLWYRPHPQEIRGRGPFHATWLRLAEYGRWTPEAERARAGLPLETTPEQGPDAREFL